MAEPLRDWVDREVGRVRDRPMRWLAGEYFFRDPPRPTYSDSRYFFAPADGVLLYQRTVAPDETLLEIKGRPYTLREALRDERLATPCLAIGIFMTMYDVHVNRIPYAGTLTYRLLPPIDTHNRPMLPVETALLRGHVAADAADYLFANQRVVNRVYASELGLSYHVLQIADYDVSAIAPFDPRQNLHFAQNQRFSQVRYGSQVDLVIPLSAAWTLETLLADTTHVEAGIDPLVRVEPREARR